MCYYLALSRHITVDVDGGLLHDVAGKALQGAEYVVSAVPVQVTYSEILSYKEHIPEGVPVITVSKGICSNQKLSPEGKQMDEKINLAKAKAEAGSELNDADKAVLAAESTFVADPTYKMTMDEAEPKPPPLPCS